MNVLIIPTWILNSDIKLTSSEAIVYGLIYTHCTTTTKPLTMTNIEICEVLQISDKTLKRALLKLENLKLISRDTKRTPFGSYRKITLGAILQHEENN